MLQRVVVVIAVFLVLLVALSMGERISHQTLHWVSSLTQWLVGDVRELSLRAVDYVQANPVKVVLALLLTIPVSYWIIRRPASGTPGLSTRRMAIVLALGLGWLGAHRFYLGQIAWGLFYLVIAYLYVPLAVVIGLIDAMRFALMSEQAFPDRTRQRRTPPRV